MRAAVLPIAFVTLALTVVTVVLAALMLAGCPAPIAPVPYDKDAPGDYPEPPDFFIEVLADGSPEAERSPCGRACANLRTVGCSDGAPLKGVSCYRACLAMAEHQRVPTKCWASAPSVDAARACGALRCRPR